MTTTRKVTLTAAGAAAVAAAVAFTPTWEGMDKVARRDPVGTGHPITYCYGQTSEFGDVKVGTRFTKKECDAKLAESLPKYLAAFDACVKVPVPPKLMGALLDGAYNFGHGRICKSPMVTLMNAGNLADGCRAFKGYIVTGNHHYLYGLAARRGGVGDPRKSEMDLCLEGLKEPKATWATVWTARATPVPAPSAPVPPKVCGGEWTDDRTYTSHPECRKRTAPLSVAPKRWWQL